jgi:2'-5' RNA ligase
MRRNIVHLIRGEAGKTHEAITKSLVDKFDAFPIHDLFPPHLTLKRGFELDSDGVNSLYLMLDIFAITHPQSEFRLQGFDHFREDVIYVDVEPSQEMSMTVRELISLLHGIKDMEFHEYDDIEDDFHATVVMRDLKPFDYEQVWNYLATIKQPDFAMKFDNFAVMRREPDGWVIDRVWELGSEK